jgi:GTP cyclohydrolase I
VIPAETHDEMVIVKDIPYGFCEHHLCRCWCRSHAHIRRRANRRFVELARVADMMARSLRSRNAWRRRSPSA